MVPSGTVLKVSPEWRKKFFALVTKRANGCWIWRKNPNYYGVFQYEGRGYPAHRFSFLMHTGAIPKGLLVCHTCDVKGCVNPKHLFTGTHADNTRDHYQKNPPNPPKLKSIHARLFPADVSEIQAIANDKGIPWQVELRLIVRKALKEKTITVIK